MAAQALPLTTRLSQQSTIRTTKFKTRVAQFGDGYSQRIPDGLNAKVDTWTLVWENLTTSEMTSIVNVLDAAGSHDILTWTPFGEASEKKFILDIETGYSFTPLSGSLATVSATIKQVFDI